MRTDNRPYLIKRIVAYGDSWFNGKVFVDSKDYAKVYTKKQAFEVANKLYLENEDCEVVTYEG